MLTPRTFISFWRSRNGLVLLFLLGVLLLSATVRGCRLRAPLASREPPKPAASDFVGGSKIRQIMPFLPGPKTAPHPVATAGATRLAPIRVYAAPLVELEDALGDYAPFGRLLRCKLVITEETANIATPVVGLVLQDLWYAQKLIVPAGTEVHGVAAQERTRDRIASQGSWIIVLPGGRELTVSGIALNHAPLPDGKGWDILDGVAGMQGQIVNADNLAELKLFASAAISAAADGLKTTQPTVFGNQPIATGKNAVLAGGSKVLDSYSEQIAATLQREGTFVRVPAGKQFYLYVTETIDLSKARIGGTRVHSETRAGLGPEQVQATTPRLSARPPLTLEQPVYPAYSHP